MATTRNRTTDDVRRDIEREREQLVRAVSHLRSDVANVKPLLRKVAIGAGALIAARIALKLVLRRRRRCANRGRPPSGRCPPTGATCSRKSSSTPRTGSSGPP